MINLTEIVLKVTCGDKAGTAFLISKNQALTVFHVVAEYEQSDIIISNGRNDICKAKLSAKIDERYKVLDIALLDLDSPVEHSSEIYFSKFDTIENGTKWYSRGFPGSKNDNGDNILENNSNVVNQHLSELRNDKIDIELVHDKKLVSYQGYSGAPLIINGAIVGIIKSEMTEQGNSKELYALSLKYFKALLAAVNVDIQNKEAPMSCSDHKVLVNAQNRMSRKLRIFVSSTPPELANEREAVFRRLRTYNFEPVNEGSWDCNGNKKWQRIQSEIESCDIFLLLVGKEYGWVPDKISMFKNNLSVVHIEYNEAHRLKLPMLAFFKSLSVETHLDSTEVNLVDKLCSEVYEGERWYCFERFDLAKDLTDNVGRALIELLSDDKQKSRIAARSVMATRVTTKIQTKPMMPTVKPALPSDLIESIKSGDAVLFAGAGISLAAGLPSATAFAERIWGAISELESAYYISQAGSALAGLAADYEALSSEIEPSLNGRMQLTDILRGLMELPQGIRPTFAHLTAVNVFSLIFTTNYDNLFEMARTIQNVNSKVIFNEQKTGIPEQGLVKLHGTFDKPMSLIISENDIAMFDKNRPQVWQTTIDMLKRKKIVVIGSSLRDPSILRLFNEVGEQMSGYFVAPDLMKSTPARLGRFNLQCIKMNADEFFTALVEKSVKKENNEI